MNSFRQFVEAMQLNQPGCIIVIPRVVMDKAQFWPMSKILWETAGENLMEEMKKTPKGKMPPKPGKGKC